MHNHVKCSYVSNGWRMFQAWFTAARSSTARPFLLLEDPGDLSALRTSRSKREPPSDPNVSGLPDRVFLSTGPRSEGRARVDQSFFSRFASMSHSRFSPANSAAPFPLNLSPSIVNLYSMSILLS